MSNFQTIKLFTIISFLWGFVKNCADGKMLVNIEVYLVSTSSSSYAKATADKLTLSHVLERETITMCYAIYVV